MNVASLELCTTLYKLSAWGDDIDTVHYLWALEYEYQENRKWGRPELRQKYPLGASIVIPSDHADWTRTPAYELGYLVRKFAGNGLMIRYGEKGCIASSQPSAVEADTPENAVCELAINLFKLGVLKREQR